MLSHGLETVVNVNEETGEETVSNMPVEKPIITKMTVETFGVNYSEPEVHPSFDMNQYLMDYYGFSF